MSEAARDGMKRRGASGRMKGGDAMPGKLIDVVEYLDMVDEIYLEEDGTYFHHVCYREGGPEPADSENRKPSGHAKSP